MYSAATPVVRDGFLDRHQNVDLGGHVQRRCRFVEHHQIRLGTQRQRGHATLQLTARNLMRIPLTDIVRVGQTQLGEQFTRAAFGLFAR